MTKNYELNDGFGRTHARGAYPGYTDSTNGRAANGPRPVAFGGLLTNKILTGLPGADFARLLPHLEPVELACDENL